MDRNTAAIGSSGRLATMLAYSGKKGSLEEHAAFRATQRVLLVSHPMEHKTAEAAHLKQKVTYLENKINQDNGRLQRAQE